MLKPYFSEWLVRQFFSWRGAVVLLALAALLYATT